jgi:toxin HigB-1
MMSLRVTIGRVIVSFRGQDARQLWEAGSCKSLPANLHRAALRKLYLVNAAVALSNLAVPPGNRLEKLRADRAGQYSIRINDQYRICFVWRGGGAHEVEIVDYH